MSADMTRRVYMVVAVALAAACSGCLSVVRLAKLDDGSRRVWSEERQEHVVHEWRGDPKSRDLLAMFGLYPTMQMRWQLLRVSCHWAPKQCWWGQHVGIPFGLLALTPGMLVDVVVDTVALPWDWKYRHNVPHDMCAGLDEERRCRSLCTLCGATSDGEFARARRDADRDTQDWRRFYGVCPKCIQKAKAEGYRFDH